MSNTLINGLKKTIDPAAEDLLEKAKADGIETAWDRYDKQLPQCGFGDLGLCCRNCLMGPCRINPFGEPSKGVCGADADLMVARNLLRSVTGGASCHVDHAYEAAELLLAAAEGGIPYEVKDEAKLAAVAGKLGISVAGKDKNALAKEVALEALSNFQSHSSEPMSWLTATAPAERAEVWQKLGIAPRNPDREIREVQHQTSMGVDSDPVNMLLATLKMGLVDGYGGLSLGTDMQDIIFGTPTPVKSAAQLGVLEKNKVNVIVHGHMPVVSEKVVEWSRKLEDEAKAAGAEGIVVAGICCSGNEVLMRQGIPSATNFMSQELAIVTGVVDLMVVDVQCMMPSLSTVAACYHTKLVTTQSMAKIPGAEHIEFDFEGADEAAKKAIRMGIEAFKNRDERLIDIPKLKNEAWAGFSVEAIVGALSKVDPENPLKPLVDNIINGNVLGAVGVVGCNNVKVTQDEQCVELIKELLANNVLVVATGCTGHTLAKHGFMSPEGAKKYCGPGLLAVLTAVGEAAGLGGPLPGVLHMGSCVDNSRIGDLLSALAGYLGVSVSQLPVAASAPELQHEKALSIGTWAVAMGVLTHVGCIPPVLGSELTTKVLTEGTEDLVGGKFFVDLDPHSTAVTILEHIKKKRAALGI